MRECLGELIEAVLLGTDIEWLVLYAVHFILLNANVLPICLGAIAIGRYRRRLGIFMRLGICVVWAILWVAFHFLMIESHHYLGVLLYMLSYPVAFAVWPWVSRRRTIFVLAAGLALLPFWIWKPAFAAWHVSHLIFLWMWPWLERHRNWMLLFSAVCFTPVLLEPDFSKPYFDILMVSWPLFLAIPVNLGHEEGWCFILQAFPITSLLPMMLVLFITYVLWKKFSRFGDEGNAQRVSKTGS